MNRIPPKLRRAIAGDPTMARCFRHGEGNCSGRVEWEHAHTYAGSQIQERWAIVPCCTFHHRGKGLDKNLNRYASLLRMTEAEMEEATRKYPRTDWQQLNDWLGIKYPTFILVNAAAVGPMFVRFGEG